MTTGIILAEPATLALGMIALLVLGGLFVVVVIVGVMIMGVYN